MHPFPCADGDGSVARGRHRSHAAPSHSARRWFIPFALILGLTLGACGTNDEPPTGSTAIASTASGSGAETRTPGPSRTPAETVSPSSLPEPDLQLPADAPTSVGDPADVALIEAGDHSVLIPPGAEGTIAVRQTRPTDPIDQIAVAWRRGSDDPFAPEVGLVVWQRFGEADTRVASRLRVHRPSARGRARAAGRSRRPHGGRYRRPAHRGAAGRQRGLRHVAGDRLRGRERDRDPPAGGLRHGDLGRRGGPGDPGGRLRAGRPPLLPDRLPHHRARMGRAGVGGGLLRGRARRADGGREAARSGRTGRQLRAPNGLRRPTHTPIHRTVPASDRSR